MASTPVRAGLFDWVNEGKAKAAVAAAGDYDAAATKAQVQKYIADNPVSEVCSLCTEGYCRGNGWPVADSVGRQHWGWAGH